MKTVNEILAALKTTLVARDFDKFDDEYLLLEIEQAIGTINRCRRFTPSGSKLYDEKYEYLIVPMCVASLAKIGAEGQNQHSENGVLRGYDDSGNYPPKLISQIVPLIK